MRVLYVEDSSHLRESIATALRRGGYAIDTASDGEDGLFHARCHAYDVIILDIMLPKLDGLSLLRRLRVEGNAAQVLLLTAKDTVDDRVRGLRHGADDYLIKPFALEELLARVQALCRRHYQQKNPCLRLHDLEVDTRSCTAKRAGVALELTPREYRILEYLARRMGEVVPRADIWSHVYDEHSEPMSNAVDSAVCGLRKKVDPPGATALLHTRRGLGYLLGFEAP